MRYNAEHCNEARPRSWVEANGLEVGGLLPIDIEELPIEGSATVTAIEAAPAIATGEGSAVTGRFITRRVDEICRIEVLGADGQIDTIEGTTLHPIWSVDRDDWVPLGELQEDEQLLSSLPSPHLGRGIEGEGQTATILAHQVLHRTIPVYNIEVHGEHVYQVGALEILVHNNCITHMHHSIPRAIQRRLADAGNAAAASAADVIGRAGLPNRIPVNAALHRLIHSGKGYIQNRGIGGGHYNNAFHRLIMNNGGYKRVTADDLVRMRNILVSWFKL